MSAKLAAAAAAAAQSTLIWQSESVNASMFHCAGTVLPSAVNNFVYTVLPSEEINLFCTLNTNKQKHD